MDALKLIRMETSDEGTFGKIYLPDGLTFFTGELPWRENQNDISCIPEGNYFCTWTFSNRFKRNMYLVTPVRDRAGIRIHSANLMGDSTKGFKKQLNGCISLGEKFGWIEGQKAILASGPAVRRFEEHMDHKPFSLEITWKSS